jgi:prephenate dehydrogenase
LAYGDVGTIFNLAGGGIESTVRLAKSSPEMWNPIFAKNREHILSALDLYMQHLENFRDTLKKNKPEKTFKLMNNANSIKRVLQSIKVAK